MTNLIIILCVLATDAAILIGDYSQALIFPAAAILWLLTKKLEKPE